MRDVYPYVMDVQSDLLKAEITSLRDRSHEIIAAMDAVLSGI